MILFVRARAGIWSSQPFSIGLEMKLDHGGSGRDYGSKGEEAEPKNFLNLGPQMAKTSQTMGEVRCRNVHKQ